MLPRPVSALSLLFLVAIHSIAVADPARWEADIMAFEKSDAENPPPKGAALFIGSSSIRLWKTLAQDFPDQAVINRGFGGSQMEDSVAFIDRIVVPYQPRKIFIYAGANDINAGKTPEQVLADFQAFVEQVQKKVRRVEILFISIAGNPARWQQVDEVRRANALVADYAKRKRRVEFIDVFTAMMGPDGLPQPDIFVDDRLHMNEKGYAIWREVIAPHLAKR